MRKRVPLFYVILFLTCAILSCGSGETVAEEDNDIEKYIDFPNYKPHQSMAVYGDEVFFITPRNGVLMCDIYNAKTTSYLGKLELPYGSHVIPHANVSCFGKKLYDTEKSIYPCLYVSQWDGNRLAFVYDFNQKETSVVSSLIQIIDPSHLNGNVVGHGNLDWVVDEMGEYLYSVAYKLKDSAFTKVDNAIHITKFPVPDIHDGDYIFLEDADIIDAFTLPIINANQDKCFYNGYLYIASGYTDPEFFVHNKLFRVDVLKKVVESSSILLTGEPEGVSCYNSRLMMNMDDDSGRVYYLEHYLSKQIL